MAATCKSCGAALLWVTSSLGKPVPLDAKPEKRWVQDLNGRWGFRDTHTSHFATCPDADRFRRKT